MPISRDTQLSPCLLTIITVCRNDADRLAKTLDSLKDFYGDQRYEHIVVDGESSDHTKESIASLGAISNFHFISEKDEGIYDAMNRGLAYGGSGAYFLFLNCGDCIQASPEEIADYLGFVDSSGQAVEIICFPFCEVGVGGLTMKIIPDIPRAHKLPTSHQGMIFSRRFCCSNRYDTQYKIAADYDLYLRADFSRIVMASVPFSLSSVEIDGVASGNPITAYSEYVHIAAKNLKGLIRFVALARIITKAFFVILLKQTLPRGWIAYLRGRG